MLKNYDLLTENYFFIANIYNMFKNEDVFKLSISFSYKKIVYLNY